jgi:hypothetical protein
MVAASCFQTHGFCRAPQHEGLSPHPEERARLSGLSDSEAAGNRASDARVSKDEAF